MSHNGPCDRLRFDRGLLLSERSGHRWILTRATSVAIDPEPNLHCATQLRRSISLRYLRLPPGCTHHANGGPYQGSPYALAA